MKGCGVGFTGDIADHGDGLVTYFEVPGGITVQLAKKNPLTAMASRPAAKAAKKTAAKKPAKKKK